MKQKKCDFKASIMILIFLGLYSCQTTKNQVNKKQGSDDVFVYGEKVNEEESYATIKGSVARLRAILCGKFVHYTMNPNSEEEEYVPWLVNENQDSVLHFHLPVGDYRKDGYWIYEYQCLTSLVDQPIVETFVKLEELNRDSIQATFYASPEGFSGNIIEILKSPKEFFNEISLKKIAASGSQGEVYYVRQTPIQYIGESNLEDAKAPSNKGGYESFYYKVGIGKTELILRGYNKDMVKLGETKPEWLVKVAMVNTKWLGL